MPDPRVPEHLQAEILAGRCVAFVGAGLTAPVVPTWRTLLTGIAARLPPAARADVQSAVDHAPTALDLEAAGQMLRDRFATPAAFEAAVADVLEAADPDAALARRLAWLRQIPFEAVLTTNIDPFLAGDGPCPSCYDRVLRRHLGWWERADWAQGDATPQRPVLKLHGDANRDPDDNPVVLARGDYRARLYEDARYSNFLRVVFATRTVLFLGVSFTDAYLNEIRSEVLALLGPASSDGRPRAYAVLPDRTPAQREYFLRHEGIEVLGYDIQRDAATGEPLPAGFAGFDRWLEAVCDATSAEARLGRLLGGRRIAWLDPAPHHNEHGVALLERSGAKVEILAGPDELSEARHAGLDLLISHYGHRAGRDAVAVEVLGRVGRWADRPPVIVFASGHYADENRWRVLRLGAFEYGSGWRELFRLIEQLFGRAVGA